MPEPTNKKLYEEVKKEIYAKYPKHSAYRSGLLVQEYKNVVVLISVIKTTIKGWGDGLGKHGSLNAVRLDINTKGMCIVQRKE